MAGPNLVLLGMLAFLRASIGLLTRLLTTSLLFLLAELSVLLSLPEFSLTLLLPLLSSLRPSLLRDPGLSEQRREQQKKHCYTVRNSYLAQHSDSPIQFSTSILRIRGHVVLYLQLIEHIEIREQLVVPVQRL